MQTTCPECRTTYRIAQAQLSLRRGLVRCGHCNTVFNAYDSLLPDLNAEPPPHTSIVRSASRVSSRLYNPAQEPASLTEVVNAAPPPAQRQVVVIPVDQVEISTATSSPIPEEAGASSMPTESSALLYPYTSEEKLAVQPEESPTQDHSSPTAPSLIQIAEETSDSILLSELPICRPNLSPRTRSWLTALYTVLAFMLLAALLLQLTWLLRAEIASIWPSSRPLLTRACDVIGCVVPLPRQLVKDAIVTSSLEHDPENKSRVRLILLLANRTGQVQAWPDVLLTLTDLRDSPVGQTQFKPPAYLPKNSTPGTGMASDSEWEIRLDLEIGNLDASGYTLDLVYP